jgi:dethiobiotin synthetase
LAGLFIAGTDTGVGKTVITAGIAGYLRTREVDCGVMKPVEAGSLSGSKDSDSVYLKRISDSPDDLDLINTYAFEAPLAPGVAAEQQGAEINFDRIYESYKKLEILHPQVLVEGAGGLIVPLGKHRSLVDLIKYLNLPVLLVARLGLGTLNHTLLSLAYLENQGIPVAGVVLNCDRRRPDLSARYNRSTLEQWTRVPIWGIVDHITRLKNREEVIQTIESGIGDSIDEYFL